MLYDMLIIFDMCCVYVLVYTQYHASTTSVPKSFKFAGIPVSAVFAVALW
jgi:hypothetical protein